MKDAPILAAAVHANADILATGDLRDFGHLFGKSLRGVRILTLAKTIEAILDQVLGTTTPLLRRPRGKEL